MLEAFRPLPTLEPEGSTGGSILADAAALAAQPAPPPPAGSPEAMVQEAADGPPEWVPEKFWDREKKAPRIEDLGRGYKNLEQLLGREKVPVPTSDDDKEGWERWYKAHGRPEKPDEYEWERPTLPEDLPYDEDREKHYRQVAHQLGLNKKQAKGLYEAEVKMQIERNIAWHEMQKENKANAEMALRRELGNKYDGYIRQTGSLYKQYADPEFESFLSQTGLGNDPRMIRMLGRIAQDMGGETKLQGKPQNQAQPADVDKAISEFRGKHAKALFDRSHPDNERLTHELQRLYQMKGE